MFKRIVLACCVAFLAGCGGGGGSDPVVPPVDSKAVLKDVLVQIDKNTSPQPPQANPLVLDKGQYSLWVYGEMPSNGSTIGLMGTCTSRTLCSNTGSPAAFATDFTLSLEGDAMAGFSSSFDQGNVPIGLDLTGSASGATITITIVVKGGATVRKVLNVR